MVGSRVFVHHPISRWAGDPRESFVGVFRKSSRAR